MGDEDLIEMPKVVATFVLKLHDDGNMSMEFSGSLTDSKIAEHMLKKTLQAIDDEQFNVYLEMRKQGAALVKAVPGGALNGLLNGLGNVDLGTRNNG